MTMNVTDNILPTCNTCLTSNGFSSADRRSIIVMVILASIALLGCYLGVLWYAIRTRAISDKGTHVIVHNNEAFNKEDEQNEEFKQSVGNPTTTQIHFPEINTFV